MRRLSVSESYFTLDGEFIDGSTIMELNDAFGNSKKTLNILLAEVNDEQVEIKTTIQCLNAFWQQCRNDPATPQELSLWEGEYKHVTPTERFHGNMTLYLNCWYDKTAEKTTVDDESPQPEQLNLFEV